MKLPRISASRKGLAMTWFKWQPFGAPAKTAGKRAVRFQTLHKQKLLGPKDTMLDPLFTIKNHSERNLYVTISLDFTKAGKK